MNKREVNGIDFSDNKCTCCGCTELLLFFIEAEGGGGFEDHDIEVSVSISNAESFICKNCGHVEWFVMKHYIDKTVKEREERQQWFEKRKQAQEQKS